jgi:tRNA (guanine-N1)-methyltransferase
MRFDVVTLFPELFTPLLTTGVTRRAYEAALLNVHFTNPRDFALKATTSVSTTGRLAAGRAWS